MTDKEEIEALQLENSTLRDIVDEQNESISELQQQVAALQEALENSKAAEHAAAQANDERTAEKEALQHRNALLQQWLDKGLTWESMFAQIELENTRLRQALKALTN